MIGSLFCFRVGDYLGRRRELLIAAFMYFVGGAFEMLASFQKVYPDDSGLVVLLFGRSIYGIACGFAMHGAPSYIAEMAPPDVRGLLVSLKEGLIVLGILMGYVVGYAYESTVGGWGFIYGASCLMAVIMAVGTWLLPPSARWLVLCGKRAEALAALKFVTPGADEDDVQEIYDQLSASQEQSSGKSRSEEGSSDWAKLLGPTCKLALIAGCGLVFLQQVTGQPSVLYYADTIFKDVGLDSVASVLTGTFKLVATLYAVATVDSQGRKKLLYIGCVMMLVALLLLAVCFAFPYTSYDQCEAMTEADSCGDLSGCEWSEDACGVTGLDGQKVTILGAMFLYIGGYQVGFGPIAWLIISEVFPLELRGKAISVAVVSNFFWMTVESFLFPVQLELFGASVTFFVFALIDAYAIYFIYRYVPETKGLSLEEIEQFFLKQFRLNDPSAQKSFV